MKKEVHIILLAIIVFSTFIIYEGNTIGTVPFVASLCIYGFLEHIYREKNIQLKQFKDELERLKNRVDSVIMARSFK